MTYDIKERRMKVFKIGLIVFLLIASPYILFGVLIGYSLLKNDPPESFDFSIYENHVVRADIVIWDASSDNVSPNPDENYKIIITLDQSQIPELLTNLSEIDFYRKGPGDPPEFGGRCFLLTLDDGSYRLVGRRGYARYISTDEHLTRYTDLWRYIREDDYDELFAPYLGY